MSKCLICKEKLREFLDLGKQPSANNFLTYEDLKNDEFKYDLKLGYCSYCKVSQIIDGPSKKTMFHDDYAYHTSVNKPMVDHFHEFANKIKGTLSANDFIVEIGSNDGAFLENFIEHYHVGVEPCKNVAKIAKDKGINCIEDFFNDDLANELVETHDYAKLIYAANVIGHAEDINSIISGVKCLLDDEGIFVFEIYYLPSIIEDLQFDLIYDEHVFYHTLTSINNMLDAHGLELYDYEQLTVHGRSIRGYVTHKDAKKITHRLHEQLRNERAQGYTTINPLIEFSNRIKSMRENIISEISSIYEKGFRIVGYGATAKSTTMMNYCDLGKYVDYIVDSTPAKQHKWTPGTHVAIFNEAKFEFDPPDYVIIFAWNYADSIMKKNSNYTGKWIILGEKVRII